MKETLSGSSPIETTITLPPPQFTVSRHPIEYSNGSYSVNATFPYITGGLPSYSLKAPKLTKEWAGRLAEDLGMSSDIRESSDAFSANSSDDGKFYFSILKETGEISFQKTNGRSGKPQAPAQAISAANDFLTKHDMMPADASDPVINYNGGQSISPSGKLQNDWQTSVINYKRKINGLPVIGAAAILEIELDSNGNVIEIHKNWPEYQINKTGIAKSPEKAFREFEQTKLDTFSWPSYPFWPERIVVDQIDLGYVRGMGNESNYLKPVYTFWGYGIQGNKTENYFIGISISATERNPDIGQ